MKKLNKIFTAVAVSLVLLCSTGQQAKAQFVVTDPASLVQSILQFLQDLDRWTDDAMEMSETLQQYKDKFDDFQQSLIVAQNFASGYKTAFDILDISKSIVETGGQILSFQNFFSANSCTPYYYKCKALKSSYDSISKDYVEQVKDQFANLSSMKNASGLDYLTAVKGIAEDLQIRLNGLANTALGQAADLYDNYMFGIDAKANEDFLKMTIN